jgi:hypothetical protein
MRERTVVTALLAPLSSRERATRAKRERGEGAAREYYSNLVEKLRNERHLLHHLDFHAQLIVLQ